MKTAVIVFSTHLKLDSMQRIIDEVRECGKMVFFTPQFVFENEREHVNNIFKGETEFVCFADIINDSDGERCDFECFKPYQDTGKLSLSDMYAYFADLTKAKNELLVQKIDTLYHPVVKLILSDDLGIVLDVWQSNGYKFITGEYYSIREKNTKTTLIKKIFRKGSLLKIARRLNINYPQNIHVARYNGKTILFHGHLERAGYRINLEFKENGYETFKHWIVKLLYVILRIRIDRKNVINLTTLHEYGNYAYYEMMDIPEFHNYLFQDGYLPPNDTCKYLFFYGKHSHFLTWDKLGNMVFDYHKIPASILSCRNVFPLPYPCFKPIKKILCVSSGAGDWTAIKNRSDEDKTVAAFVQMAKRYPNIEFTYRCHPSWTSATIQGVNSIQRVVEYFDWLGLRNIKVSSNIPAFYDDKGNVVVSHKRSSLESDLKDADFVFGVHSISMLDGAMQKLPFASVNLSGRRNLWKGISDLGFPHCEDVNSIAQVIESVMNNEFQVNYNKAIERYNKIIQEN